MMSRNMVKSKASSVQPSQAANQASHWSLVGSFHHGTGESEAPAAFVMAFLKTPWNRNCSTISEESACRRHARYARHPREDFGEVLLGSVCYEATLLLC
jgi:hypothetical protein